MGGGRRQGETGASGVGGSLRARFGRGEADALMGFEQNQNRAF